MSYFVILMSFQTFSSINYGHTILKEKCYKNSTKEVILWFKVIFAMQ